MSSNWFGSARGDLRLAPVHPPLLPTFIVRAIILGLFFAVIYQLGVPLRATRGARVNVDEPFYLLTTVSLLEDGDLDLTNDYALRRYRAFFDHPSELWYQSAAMPDGRVLSPHNVGLSVLIMPGYALAGVDGAKALLGGLGGLTIAITALLGYRATGRKWASLVAAAVLGGTAPLFIYSTQIYPEMPAALIVTICAWGLLGARPGMRAAVLLAIGLGALPWLGSKYCLVGGALGLLALVRMQGAPRIGLIALSSANALAYAWFHLTTYGGLTPYTVNRLYAGRSTMELVALHVELWNRLYRLLGIWVDGEFGLIRWAPVLLVVLPVIPALMRRRGPERWIWPGLLIVQLLVATFFSITMRGWWFPGRMLIVVLPLLVIPLAEGLGRAAGHPVHAMLAGILALYSVSLTAALVMAGRTGEIVMAVDPFSIAWPPFQAISGLFPVYTSFSAMTWVQTILWTLVLAGLVTSISIWRLLQSARVRAGQDHVQRHPA